MAAAHFETGSDVVERAALEWLQNLVDRGDVGLPHVAAGNHAARAQVTRFIPVNDKAIDAKKGGLLQSVPIKRKKVARSFARAWLDDEVVHLLWPEVEPSDDITFNGDEDLLRRMILNLLDNAIKYTPNDGLVSIRLWRENNQVKLRVTDNGIGIPAEAASRVFERFYRVDKARSRAEGGSGLGLPIVKWIAEAHHGSVSLESEPERGSSFTVALPAGV